MVLYVDETENEEYFIVAGLLAENEASINLAYRQFKNKIKGYKISQKAKSRLYTEFKSVLMDRNYPKYKRKMLEEISSIDCSILYAYYSKNGSNINQILKQSIYITLISEIVSCVEGDVDIVFDGFGIEDFESDIVKGVRAFSQVTSARPGDSQEEKGLQFIDNLCSTIRRHISTDEQDMFYDVVSNQVRIANKSNKTKPI